MSLSRSLKIALLSIPLAVASAVADAVDVETVASGGFWMRDNQLHDIGDLLLLGKGSYFDIGFNYMPLSTQIPLRSAFGEHEGYASRHHIAFLASHPFKENQYLNLLLWFERSGWDTEDYFFFPRYSDFGLVRSVTTWGVGYTNAKLGYSVAAGMQHQNVEYVGKVFPAENDSLLYSWANLRYGRISAQVQFHRTDLRLLRFSFDLEDRAVFGGASSGIWTYLPNIDATMYKRRIDGADDDFIRVNWEQNLYGQRLYAEVSYDFPDDGFHSAALKYYPDPSRFVALELTCLRRRVLEDNWDDLMLGWAIELPILRIGYNAASEYDHLFHAKGTWIVEFHFNLESLDGLLFAKNGRQPVELETRQVKRKNTPEKPAETIPLTGAAEGSSGTASKTITAKGIRYEKSGQSTQGDK